MKGKNNMWKKADLTQIQTPKVNISRKRKDVT